jgi:exopolyphosphatase / guanosine-5'-triphosphate,3'-diphosphate pyrophosphatase
MRAAAIDIGTNSVLLLVAERNTQGRWSPLAEQAEVTRLGQGVDASRRLLPQAIEATLQVLERYTQLARDLGATQVVATATSAARDAANGPEFVAAVAQRTGLRVEILSGDDEARLSFASAWADFGATAPMAMLDIGGGSTELVVGQQGSVQFRRSFDVGSVRLTERLLQGDPPTEASLTKLQDFVAQVFTGAPSVERLVGVAGTVTTVLALHLALEPYDSTRVHGATLRRADVRQVFQRLCATPLAQRQRLRGLQPKRADVIIAGVAILLGAIDATGVDALTVSDRGLRWGLLADRFKAGV